MELQPITLELNLHIILLGGKNIFSPMSIRYCNYVYIYNALYVVKTQVGRIHLRKSLLPVLAYIHSPECLAYIYVTVLRLIKWYNITRGVCMAR